LGYLNLIEMCWN